jgi:hypothetical protein
MSRKLELVREEKLFRLLPGRSNEATPLSSQATASPSMMQERERRRANVSTIAGSGG